MHGPENAKFAKRIFGWRWKFVTSKHILGLYMQ